MTEEIVKSITEAEEKAAEIKRIAQETAAKILADAEKNAARTESSSAEICKAYTETQIKTAKAEAENRYISTLETELQNAKKYCAQILEKSEIAVNDVVGRITSGNR